MAQNFDLFGVATPPKVMAADDLARSAAEGTAMGLDEVVAYALTSDDVARPTTHPEDR